MSMRIHVADIAYVDVGVLGTGSIAHDLGDDFIDIDTTALALVDNGNGEAFVLEGGREDLIEFARDLLARAEDMLT